MGNHPRICLAASKRSLEEKVAAIGCYESELNKVFMQLDSVLIMSRFWSRELGQKGAYFETSFLNFSAMG